MPEDQETLTPTRRRARRQDAAATNAANETAPQLTDAANGANGATEGAEATESAAPKRRRTPRAAEQPALPAAEMATSEEAPPKPRRAPRAAKATPASDSDAASDEAPPPKRRTTRAKATVAENVAENVATTANEAPAAEMAAGEETPRPRRAATPRVRHTRGEAAFAPQDAAPSADLSETAATPDRAPEAESQPQHQQSQQHQQPGRRGFTVWVNQEQRPGERSSDVPGSSGSQRQPQRPHQSPAPRGGQGQGSMPYRPGSRGGQQQQQRGPGQNTKSHVCKLLIVRRESMRLAAPDGAHCRTAYA